MGYALVNMMEVTMAKMQKPKSRAAKPALARVSKKPLSVEDAAAQAAGREDGAGHNDGREEQESQASPFRAKLNEGGDANAEISRRNAYRRGGDGPRAHFFKPGNPGRPKGCVNKLTNKTRSVLNATARMTPLEFMVKLMCDEGQPLSMRLDAARSAAPYLHAKLSVSETTVRDASDFSKCLTVEEVVSQLEETCGPQAGKMLERVVADWDAQQAEPPLAPEPPSTPAPGSATPQ